MWDLKVKNKRNRSGIVAESITQSVEAISNEGVEPTFNTILEHLRNKRVLSNHRALRVYLDLLVKSGVLSRREEQVKQPNVRMSQKYMLTHNGPFVEVGGNALQFYGLNWTVPAKSSVRVKTDIDGLVRARLSEETLYGSLEDVVVEMLARSKGRERISEAIYFSAALLATKKFDHAYLMRRADERAVRSLIQGILDAINYLLVSPKPEVEDIKSLYNIRKRIHPILLMASVKTSKPVSLPISPDELVDVIGKQLGVK